MRWTRVFLIQAASTNYTELCGVQSRAVLSGQSGGARDDTAIKLVRHVSSQSMRVMRIKAAAVVSLLATADGLATTATKAPIWLTMPAVSSEAALAAAAPLQMLPPRRVVDTSYDGSGRPTPGRCLPYALLLQLQNQESKAAARVPTGADVAAIDQLRNTVLDFAVANVIENRGWAPTWPRPLAVRLWAARLKTTPREGCDAAFLFAAAACYGMRVHVHYKTRAGLMANTQFAAPSSAPAEMQPRLDVHIGFCEGESDRAGHYVAMPNALTGT